MAATARHRLVHSSRRLGSGVAVVWQCQAAVQNSPLSVMHRIARQRLTPFWAIHQSIERQEGSHQVVPDDVLMSLSSPDAWAHACMPALDRLWDAGCSACLIHAHPTFQPWPLIPQVAVTRSNAVIRSGNVVTIHTGHTIPLFLLSGSDIPSRQPPVFRFPETRLYIHVFQ